MPIRRRMLLALAAILVVGPGARGAIAEESLPPAGTRPEITADDVRARIRYLASEGLEGRMSIEKGGFAASQYVADEFKRVGLKSLGGEGGWFQDFNIPMPKLGEGNALEAEVAGTKSSFAVETDWNPFSVSPKAEASGELVFAGFGVTNADKAYDDYAGLDVTGKVVLVFRKEPPWQKEPTRHATFLAKLNEAAKHGAAALLLVNDPRTTGTGPDAIFDWRQSLGPPPGSGKIPYAFVSMRVATALLAPLGRSLAALEWSIYWVPGAPRPASAAVPGVTVRIRTAMDRAQGKNARNVVGFLEGSDERLRDEVVVIGAHHDHVGHGFFGSAGTPSDVGKIHPGADDNASGTAALLELAESFAAAKERPRRSLLFLSFTGEELGLLGSIWYVEHPIQPLEKIVTMVNCDMVGRYDEKTGMEIGGVGSGAGLQDIVDRANAPYGLKLTWDPQGVAPSDNTSFFVKKIPVLFFFTGLHSDYHTPRDTWDKIRYDDEVKITSMCRDVVTTIADRDERIAYTKPPKRAGGRAALNISLGGGDESEGVVVGDIDPEGAAAEAGLLSGDVIKAFDAVVVKSLRDLAQALAAKKPGDEVLVKFLREGEEKALKVKLGSR